MKPVFDGVVIFCPELMTGGPEALHQLGRQIARHGGIARMAYFGDSARMDLRDGVLRCDGAAPAIPAQYARYDPQVLTELRLTADTLMVFPEPLSRLAATAAVPCQRAVWWLSLDNALPQHPELADEAYRRRYFADPRLVHFYQSDYVRAFLVGSGAIRVHPLSDYTDPDFVHRSLIASENPPIGERARRVCFFPSKGAERAARFMGGLERLEQPAEYVPIRGMTKAQVRETLFGARLFIDFGHHPGKDRVPREAAIAGAVVLLHAAGAARHFADHPLLPEDLFAEDDIDSGALHRKVEAILNDPEPHAVRQAFYRNAILLERERFDLEVRSFFFSGL
jgi:hypothetical protein